ncbi:MAG: hemolysin family protein [Methanoculleaceae archaeon]
MTIDVLYFEICLFIICLLLSAFFSGSEVALISLSRAKTRALVSRGVSGAGALEELKKDIDHVIITILIGNNIVNVAAAAIATAVAVRIYGDAGVGIATGVVVLLMLIFGEIGPKTFAARHTERVALSASRPILVMKRLIAPVLWLYDAIRRGPAGGTCLKPSVTEEEIKEWIDVGEEEGAIPGDEREMLYSVFRFSDTIAREIMTPRVDVTMLEDTSPLSHAMNVFQETGFSRIPIYHEHTDNIVGVLNVKDLFGAIVSTDRERGIPELMYPPYFVPESKKIDVLLKELRARKMHMAIVLDEYGAFAGVVTVEDILEELVGEIMDEFDQEEPEIRQIGPGTYLVDARLWVWRINEILGIDLPLDESYETLGGLIIDRLGHIPRRGEVVRLEDSGITLVITAMRGRSVVEVKLIMPESEGESGS